MATTRIPTLFSRRVRQQGDYVRESERVNAIQIRFIQWDADLKKRVTLPGGTIAVHGMDYESIRTIVVNALAKEAKIRSDLITERRLEEARQVAADQGFKPHI